MALPSPPSLLSTLQIQARRQALHHVVEIVAVDLDELAFRERPQRLGRIAGEVADDADDEGQLAHDLRALGLDFIGDVDARPTHAAELFVDAGAHWGSLLRQGGAGRRRRRRLCERPRPAEA